MATAPLKVRHNGAWIDVGGGGAASASLETREAWLWPFRRSSMWNLPIAVTAQYEKATDPVTANLIAPFVNGQNIFPWINKDSYNNPIFLAELSDPMATVTDNDPTRSDVFNIPTSAVAATGNDASMTIISPDRRWAHAMWTVHRVSDTVYTCGRHELTDLTHTGFGPRQGISAAGASNMGGVIRKWETEGGPDGFGEIRHALYLQIDSYQLLYTNTTGIYDSYGYGGRKGYVDPATEQDFDSDTTYHGLVPMGSLVAMPPWYDLDDLGFTTAEKVLARCAQRHGLFVTDRATTTFGLVAEKEITQAWVDAVYGAIAKMRPYLRIVKNNTRLTPKGGIWTGDASNRLDRLAPQLVAPPKAGFAA